MAVAGQFSVTSLSGFSAGGKSLFSTSAAWSEPGQQDCVTLEVLCEGRAAVRACCARPVSVRAQGGKREGM